MGDQVPLVGERVVYHVNEHEAVFARVLRAVFWDLVDLELERDNLVVLGVRRVVLLDETPRAYVGRFERLR